MEKPVDKIIMAKVLSSAYSDKTNLVKNNVRSIFITKNNHNDNVGFRLLKEGHYEKKRQKGINV